MNDGIGGGERAVVAMLTEILVTASGSCIEMLEKFAVHVWWDARH